MTDHNSVSPGEVAGIITAAFGGLFGIGKGIQWLLGWRERRQESRAAKLQMWHDELVQRENRLAERDRDYAGRIETRLKEIESSHDRLNNEHLALRLAFEIVAAELRSNDPGNAALRRAEQLLVVAFPLTPKIPADMTATLGLID